MGLAYSLNRVLDRVGYRIVRKATADRLASGDLAGPPEFTRPTLPYDFAADPVFRPFKPWEGQVKAGFDVNFVGQLTDASFDAGPPDEVCLRDRHERPPYPPAQPDTFAWHMLFMAVLNAQRRFTMIECGDYGRWLVAAACAIRRARPDLPSSLMGVEADPTRFRRMRQHFEDNGIDPDAHRLVEGAVSAAEGDAAALSGHDPSVVGGAGTAAAPGYAEAYAGNLPYQRRAYSISTLLSHFRRVDLMVLGIGGAEARAMPAGIAAATAKVRRAHVETHGPEAHDAAYLAFRRHGWFCLHNYPCNAEVMTPYGIVAFSGKGVQCWYNARLR